MTAKKVQVTSIDPHRQFMLELVRQLITEQWKQVPLSDVLYYDLVPNNHKSTGSSAGLSSPRPSIISRLSVLSPTAVTKCKAVHTKQISLAIRLGECAVCRFELRGRKQAGNYCMTHRLALCLHIRPCEKDYDWICPDQSISCWDKFHTFYLQAGIFSDMGNLKRKHKLVMKHLQQKYTEESAEDGDVSVVSKDY
jgi:hypothetical protein